MSKFLMGLDVGSTTVKTVILKNGEIIYKTYKRHFSDIRSTVIEVLEDAYHNVGNKNIKIAVTGSGGMGIASWLGIEFVQEVIASTEAVENTMPEVDVCIELGGEDAKITYFDGQVEQRMNGSCAGGTGAFIDQMATLLKTDASGLNTLAKDATFIYPIAARCGVFAKTDVQPLLNEGAKKEDIAASILQSVVNQTIGGLACGKPIRGNIAFLGGPLHFLPELRERFIKTLNLREDQVFSPSNGELYVAIGAALSSRKFEEKNISELLSRSKKLIDVFNKEVSRLDPLFENDKEIEEFKNRHEKAKAKRKDIRNHKGKAYLGIDSGSTTSKVVLVDEDLNILYSYYGNNKGDPLSLISDVLIDLNKKMPEDSYIENSAVTGYGEGLIKAAFKIDIGEIETIAHYEAANHFLEGVDFILDIGGQDMKCLRIKDGSIDSIMLNEACSSGCGSFIEGFADSLNRDIESFANDAVYSKDPIDLGSRCTVFMNSRVKQAQKEGASVSDISAGLSYSVIKNALFKVIKIRDPKLMGKKIIVQGGTFYNDSVLRAFEKISEREAVRPDIAGLMGAFGAAKIARDRSVNKGSSLLDIEDIKSLNPKSNMVRCKICSNNCPLTITKFNHSKEAYITGNRCERPLGKTKKKELPNMFDYKLKETFNYKNTENKVNYKGTVGIPRVLNFYENYPFWFTFFDSLGFDITLSPESSKDLYEKGMETIPSESVCYPAKLVHGHIEYLFDKGLDMIFYPCLPFEKKEDKTANKNFNCPVVTSYPEVIKNNMDVIKYSDTKLLSPFLNFEDRRNLHKRLFDELSKYFDLDIKEVKESVRLGFKEQDSFTKKIQEQGERVLDYINENNMKAVVLAGRPYHIDPEVNHGIAGLVTENNMAVLTEDSICHLGEVKRPLRVVDQWTYHNRLYRAAEFVSRNDNLELIQLTSFGCGLDAVTSDQVEEILKSKNKIYTMIKIDEGNNLGAARIRIRSLKATIEDRERNNFKRKEEEIVYNRPSFTKEMKKNHTILCPQLSPIHFRFLEQAFNYSGFNFVVMPEIDSSAVDEGLKYVNNDACYPSILVVGQIVEALKSGKYDLNETSVIISQTGGGCRATNYVAFIRKALKDAGFSEIPVIALSVQQFENHPGMNFKLSDLNRLMQSLIYGDLLMRVLYRVRPYEKVKGSSNQLYEKLTEKVLKDLEKADFKTYKDNIKLIVREFDNIPITDEEKPKIGLVGEILVKFHPTANNSIVNIIEENGCEAVMPDFTDFLLYCSYNSEFRKQYLGGSFIKAIGGKAGIFLIEKYRDTLKEELNASERFTAPAKIEELGEKASKVVSLGNQTGEGWFLTAEMVELIEGGAENIVCMQPFACLPNHITGKGVIKKLREMYPYANITAIDYDPGSSEVNQLNRIKLMISIAFKNLEKKSGEKISFKEINLEDTFEKKDNPLIII